LMTFPMAVSSLSSSELADNPNPKISGKFLVTTVTDTTFLLDYDEQLVTKNHWSADSVSIPDLSADLSSGKLARDRVSVHLEKLIAWRFGFIFPLVCEVGREAYLILGVGNPDSWRMGLSTDKVSSIEQVA